MPAVPQQGISEDPGKNEAELVQSAAHEIFAVDPRVRSLGMGQSNGRPSLVAIRNVSLPVPLSLVGKISEYRNVPVTFIDSDRDPENLSKKVEAGSTDSSTSDGVPERNLHRPLTCGLQIQNYDDDHRTGVLTAAQFFVGSIGCFVWLSNGKPGFLSNNHVVAGNNRGIKGKDRILQSGGTTVSSELQVGLLSDFVALRPSPPGAAIAQGTAILNDLDVGSVEIDSNREYGQRYLPSRLLPVLSGTAEAQYGDEVFKVGRTTGLTTGTVLKTSDLVGPIPYSLGGCWFRRSFVIQGSNDTPLFADGGDSGSAIVRKDGKIVGLLFAGDGKFTWACPIAQVVKSLACVLA